MLHLIQLAWAWLALQSSLLPYVVVTVAAFGAIYAWRKLSPSSWLWLESRIPWIPELDKGEEILTNIVLALPSVTLGAALGALSTGADVKSTVLGAVAGAFAPLLHHVRKALPFDPYRGALGEPKLPAPPRVPMLPLLALFVSLVSMTVSACGALNGKSVVPCDLKDHQAQLDLATHAADCRARALACADAGEGGAGDVETCRQAVYDDCDAWGEKRCEEGSK